MHYSLILLVIEVAAAKQNGGCVLPTMPIGWCDYDGG